MRAVRIASTRRCRPRHPRTPPTGRDAALSHRRDLLPFSCPAGGRRRIPAAFRPAGVRRLPEVRLARTRVSARQVRRPPSRAPGGLFVRATRLLSIPRRTSDGGVGRASRRSRPAGATHPAVGADLPPPVALPVRRPAASTEPGPGRRLPCDLDLPHQKTGFTVASGAETGAVTLIQRFGSALNLDIHFHMLLLDGAYDFKGRRPTFHRAPRPTRAELTKLLRTIGQRVARLLERLGPLARDADSDHLDFEPGEAFDQLVGASIRSPSGPTPTGRH